MTHFRIFTAVCVAAFLVGCGGGGGGSTDSGGTGTVVGGFPTINSYVGTWVRPCEAVGNFQVTDAIELAGKDLKLTESRIYYQDAGCKGAVRGVFSNGPSSTITYASTANAQVALSAGAAISSVQVDLVTVVNPQGMTSFTGSAVYTNSNGQKCIDFAEGSSCATPFSVNAATTNDIALLVQNTNLYVLALKNSAYTVVSGPLTKR